MNSLVYIVILNYKKWQDAKECLESLFRSTYNNYKVFVIDNNSQNRSLHYLMKWANDGLGNVEKASSEQSFIKPIEYSYFASNDLTSGIDAIKFSKVNFIQNEENRGFAAGNNLILQHFLKSDVYIWLLNPDMVLKEDTLSQLVDFASKNSRKTVIGSTIKFYSDSAKVYLYGGAKINFNYATVDLITKKEDIPNLDFICGGSMFTHSSSFKDIGLLPEDYFLYWEEAEWCYKAKQNGFKMIVCEDAVCYDKISSVIGKGFIADYYYTRNGLLFISKFRQEKIPIVLFFATIRLLKRLIFFQWGRSKGMYKGIISFYKMKNNVSK